MCQPLMRTIFLSGLPVLSVYIFLSVTDNCPNGICSKERIISMKVILCSYSVVGAEEGISCSPQKSDY